MLAADNPDPQVDGSTILPGPVWPSFGGYHLAQDNIAGLTAFCFAASNPLPPTYRIGADKHKKKTICHRATSYLKGTIHLRKKCIFKLALNGISASTQQNAKQLRTNNKRIFFLVFSFARIRTTFSPLS